MDSKKRKWRIGFETSKMTLLMQTVPTTKDIESLIKESIPPVGGSLVLIQEVPLKPSATTIRFCPFCGYPFDSYEVDGLMEVDCPDCDNHIDVNYSHGYGSEDEDEDGDE